MFNLDAYEAARAEEETFDSIFRILLMSGEHRESEIEDQVLEIMDHPHLYPEYF